MPIYPVAVLLALTACMILVQIYLRSGMTIEAILKKFDHDPNWDKDLGDGAIEDLADE